MNIEKLNFEELVSKVDIILQTVQEMKDKRDKKYYTTPEVCKMIGVGKSVIDKMRKNGEISYSQIGQTYVFTQQDIDQLMLNNRVKFVG